MAIDLAMATPVGTPVPIGDPAPTFEGLLATDGQRYGLSAFADASVIVLIFSSNRCPTAKAYAERMNGLQRDLSARGVQLLAINSNDPHLYPDEAYPRMIERAAADAYTFPYVVDDGQAVARAFGAQCTFHVFVLDAARRVAYEGRFDDSRIAARVTRDDVREAVEDILAGRPVRVARTRPFGCSLDLV